MTLAILSDVHFNKIENVISVLKSNKPDLILFPGDLVNGIQIRDSQNHTPMIEKSITVLNRFSEIAPTYFSLGNHEKHFYDNEISRLYESSAIILQNSYIEILSSPSIYICGLSSGRNYHNTTASQEPNINILDCFEKLNGFKILLSHHPEYYERYIKNRNIDLIVSGHAHGGQIRIFNRGLYSPGQGFFPKYTSGFYDEKLFVSRGISGTETFPRINNKPEITFLQI